MARALAASGQVPITVLTDRDSVAVTLLKGLMAAILRNSLRASIKTIYPKVSTVVQELVMETKVPTGRNLVPEKATNKQV